MIMDREEVSKAIQRQQLADSLEQDFIGTLNERISRYQELDFPQLTPNHHFASVSAQCILLYRDGYFFACIALSQAVAEAIARLMCEKSGFSPSTNFKTNVGKLYKGNIEPDCKGLFDEIWKDRNDYHHLNLGILIERSKLQEIAKSKIIILHEIESKVFDFSWTKDGSPLPRYPKYWETTEGLPNMYLRFQP